MPYSALAHVATGELATAALHNTLLDNVSFIETGGLALASQTALDLFFASSSSQIGRLPALTALQYLRMNAAATAYEGATVASQVSLLKEGSGTTTNGSAENVDTIAMASGLTAKDRLFVLTALEAVTQATVDVVKLYNVTDSVNVCSVSGGATMLAGSSHVTTATLTQFQSAATRISGVSLGLDQTSTLIQDHTVQTFTTAWTGAWTLALRNPGIVAGGTLKWKWAVFKIAGQ